MQRTPSSPEPTARVFLRLLSRRFHAGRRSGRDNDCGAPLPYREAAPSISCLRRCVPGNTCVCLKVFLHSKWRTMSRRGRRGCTTGEATRSNSTRQSGSRSDRWRRQEFRIGRSGCGVRGLDEAKLRGMVRQDTALTVNHARLEHRARQDHRSSPPCDSARALRAGRKSRALGSVDQDTSRCRAEAHRCDTFDAGSAWTSGRARLARLQPRPGNNNLY